MSWGLVAGAAISVVGGVISSKKASDDAKKARSSQGGALAFEQEQYDEWQATYGAIEDNLSEYYSSLTPEYYMSVGLENQEQAFETSMTRINESLAQRGIENSAVAASLTSQAEIDNAEAKAKIRSDAPRQVAADKLNFLQVGLGQNPASSVSASMQNNANLLQQQATLSEQRAGQAVGSAVSTVGTGLSDYLNKQQSTPQVPDYNQGGTNYSPVTQPPQPWET